MAGALLARASRPATCRRICRKTTPRSPSRRSSIPGRATTPTSTNTMGCWGKRACSAIASICPNARPMRCRTSGSVAVFCPTSNLFLGSGLFDYQRYRRRDKAAPDRHGDRCRRRHQLFDAAHHGRGLQGDRAQRREAQPVRRPSGSSRAAMPRRCRSRTRSARWTPAPTPTSSCSMPAPRRRCGSGWKRSRRLRKSCSCCRRSATTAPCARSMSRDGRRRATLAA